MNTKLTGEGLKLPSGAQPRPNRSADFSPQRASQWQTQRNDSGPWDSQALLRNKFRAPKITMARDEMLG